LPVIFRSSKEEQAEGGAGNGEGEGRYEEEGRQEVIVHLFMVDWIRGHC